MIGSPACPIHVLELAVLGTDLVRDEHMVQRGQNVIAGQQRQRQRSNHAHPGPHYAGDVAGASHHVFIGARVGRPGKPVFRELETRLKWVGQVVLMHALRK